MKIHIKNGRLIDPAGGIDAQADLFIAAGRIAAVGAAPEGFAANRVIDATGRVVCPGLVDLSARLREPGFEYKATLESEMAAAAAGGSPERFRNRAFTATAPSVGGDTSVAKLAASCAWNVRKKLSRSGTNPPRLIVAPT